MIKKLLVLLLAWLSVAAVGAESSYAADHTSMSGYKLYEDCVSSDFHRLMCLSYINGFLDGANIVSGILKAHNFICDNGRVPIGQYDLIFLAWARQHPELLSRAAAEVLSAAFINAFPCSR